MRTNFNLIRNLNNIAGNPAVATWEAATKQSRIIDLEYKELQQAIENRDLNAVRDGIADVLVTVYGLAHRLDIDADLDFCAVVAALMTRFDTTPEGAINTKKKYDALGVPTYIHEQYHESRTYYITRVAEDVTDINGESYPKDKWLKAATFKEPTFVPLVKQIT